MARHPSNAGPRDLGHQRRGRVGAADVLGCHAVRIDDLLVGRALVAPRQGDAVLEKADELVEAGPEPGAELAPIGRIGERIALLVAPGVLAGLEDLDVDAVPLARRKRRRRRRRGGLGDLLFLSAVQLSGSKEGRGGAAGFAHEVPSVHAYRLLSC
ncbi:MAG: hypothetical protein MZV64_63910 [Ignavibacteriales bacterium]|nr:hypothetical protein [Ignavibacteriales bacterium]